MTHAIRRIPATRLAAVLLVGALGHFLHDLEHAACDPIGARDPHPCTACSVLHVGAPVGQAVALAAPGHSHHRHAAVPALAAPAATSGVAAIPRAPPAA